MNSNSSHESARVFIQGIIIIFGIIGIYYLYQYLFGPTGASEYILLGKRTEANVTDSGQIVVPSTAMAPLYDGGEFSVSTWIYIQNWSYHNGRPKHIMSIGGSSFDTIRVYLGGYQPKLHVRLHSKMLGAVTNSGSDLSASNRASLFQSLSTGDQNISESGCDLPEVDLQRWINITVAVNGRTVDIYMDGKLARSCVLDANYRVDGGGYSATLLGYGGFGGYIQNTMMYDTALSPDVVYKNYMMGLDQPVDFFDYLKGFFEPDNKALSNMKDKARSLFE
uniref:Lectin/glucanase superfamily protein n=1 Tax=viral metagenome TaxID=1070528 RepID=A0A6C0DF26_9ZZZZ